MAIETQLQVSVVPPGEDPENPYPEVDRWLRSNQNRNGYDPEVLKYPCTMVLKVDLDGTAGYLPIQSAVMLESIALREGMSPLERAECTMNLAGAAFRLGIAANKREAYMLVTDPATARAAIKAGFELLPYPVLRLRLKVDADGKASW